MNDDETFRLLGTVGPAELARLLNEIDGKDVRQSVPESSRAVKQIIPAMPNGTGAAPQVSCD